MIVVLTLGRSGSSLIMQSLKALGADVVGRAFDQKNDAKMLQEHYRLNPGGYFEEPEIYYGGPSSAGFQAFAKNGNPRVACKMDARHFVDIAHQDAWLKYDAQISAFLVSYRNPCEQARSEISAMADNARPRDETAFISTTRFLTDYRDVYGAIAERQCGKIHYVNYATTGKPEEYVERLISISGLCCTVEQKTAAIENITPKLHRIRLSAIDDEERSWADQIGASRVYETLCQQSEAR